MTICSEKSIMIKIRKEFPCEAISEPICVEAHRVLTDGNIPKFETVTCECFNGDRRKVCHVSKSYIEDKLRELGLYEMRAEIIKGDPDEEGEWR